MILSVLKKLPFWRNYTTKQHSRWWAKRKIDWKKEYFDTWNHPHRNAICYMLGNIEWRSLLELGMGAGANLAKIAKVFSGKRLGGCDVNKEAIIEAEKHFKGAVLHDCPADEVFMSDKCTDVILTDMLYIYVSKGQIKKHLKEVIRLSAKYAIFCEFHSKSWTQRFWLKLFTGYNSYDWLKLLSKMGFYDILEYKITKEDWQDSKLHQYYATIFLAKVPQK